MASSLALCLPYKVLGERVMMRNLAFFCVTLGFVILMSACAPQPEPEESCNFVQNSQGQRVSWKHRNLSIGVDVNIPQRFRVAIEESLDEWEIQSNKSFFGSEIVDMQPSEVAKFDISFVWRKDWEDDKRAEQARTLIKYKGDDLYRAVIYINNEHNDFYVSEADKDSREVHMFSLLVHEVGHALGLDHIHTGHSVMETRLASGTERPLAQEDLAVASLSCEY